MSSNMTDLITEHTKAYLSAIIADIVDTCFDNDKSQRDEIIAHFASKHQINTQTSAPPVPASAPKAIKIITEEEYNAQSDKANRCPMILHGGDRKGTVCNHLTKGETYCKTHAKSQNKKTASFSGTFTDSTAGPTRTLTDPSSLNRGGIRVTLGGGSAAAAPSGTSSLSNIPKPNFLKTGSTLTGGFGSKPPSTFPVNSGFGSKPPSTFAPAPEALEVFSDEPAPETV
jgi:hypothetical protein